MAAHAAANTASARLRLVFPWTRPVIDFLEKLVVLTNLGVVRIELQRLLVRFPRLVELAFVFVPDREVVERGGVRRIELDRPFPPVDRLAPQAALGHTDAEFDLRFRLVAGRGERRRS